MQWIVVVFLIGGSALGYYRYNVVTQDRGYQKTLADKVKDAVLEAERAAHEEEVTEEEKKSLVQVHNEIYEKVGEQTWENSLKGDTTFSLMMEMLKGTDSIVPTDEEVTEFVRKNKKQIRKVLEESAEPYTKEE